MAAKTTLGVKCVRGCRVETGFPASFEPSHASSWSRAGCSRRDLIKKCILMRPIMRLQQECKITFVFMVDRYLVLVHGHALFHLGSRASRVQTRQLLKGLQHCLGVLELREGRGEFGCSGARFDRRLQACMSRRFYHRLLPSVIRISTQYSAGRRGGRTYNKRRHPPPPRPSPILYWYGRVNVKFQCLKYKSFKFRVFYVKFLRVLGMLFVFILLRPLI